MSKLTKACVGDASHLLISEPGVKAGVRESICTFLRRFAATASPQAWDANQETKSAPDADFGGFNKISFSFFLMVSL
jgi:hypothetical protein